MTAIDDDGFYEYVSPEVARSILAIVDTPVVEDDLELIYED